MLLAYLFGSQAKEEARPRSDWDIAVLLKDGELKNWTRVLAASASALHVNEDSIDLVDISKAPLNLKHRILLRGIKLVDKGSYENLLMREVNEKYPEAHQLWMKGFKEWLLNNSGNIDKKVLESRLKRAHEEASILEQEILNKPIGEVTASPIAIRAFERSVQVLTECLLDVCRHIVSVKALGVAETYHDFVDRMTKARLISKETSNELKSFITWRNRIIHRYETIDYDALHQDAKKLVKATLPKFEGEIQNLILKELQKVKKQV